MFFLFEDADYRVGRSVHHEDFADGGFAGKQLVAAFDAEDDDAAAFVLVVVGHETAFLHFERAEALIVGPDSADGTGCGVVAADFGHASAQLGADGFDEVGFLLDEEGIADRETHFASGGVASGLFAGAAAPDDGQVDADGFQTLLLIVAEAFAETNQQNDRGDAPDDAEHGEEAAELMSCNRIGRLPQDLPDIQGCYRSLR